MTATPSGDFFAKGIFYTRRNINPNPDRAQIVSYFVDSSTSVIDIGEHSVDPSGISYDSVNRKLYWGDRDANAIMRSNMDGTAQESVAALTNPRSLAVDPLTQTLYIFSCDGGCTIRAFDIQNSQLGSPLISGLPALGGLALDSERRQIYWSEGSAIKRAQLDDFSNVETLISGLTGSVNDVYIDGPGEYIYWSEDARFDPGNVTGAIKRADLLGTNQNVVTIARGVVPSGVGNNDDGASLLGLSVDRAGGKVYWVQPSGLMRADLAPNSAGQGVLGSNGGLNPSVGGAITLGYVAIPPTPTPTPTPTVTNTPTVTPTPTLTPTPTPSATPIIGGLTVNTNDDHDDGSCDDSDCSLREAVVAANGAAGLNTIVFANNVVGTITLTAGQLSITDPVAISGPGADVLTISGNDSSRIFAFLSVPFVLSDLTIANGRASSDGGSFTNNGGGLWVSGAGTLTRVRIIDSFAAGDGGGLAISGSSADRVKLIDSEVSGNSAADRGGGIYGESAECETCLFELRNSTVSANMAQGDGGGLFITGIGLQINNSTLSNNQADSDNDGFGDGGGYHGAASSGTIGNTLIAANSDLSGGAPDCNVVASNLVNNGFNLIGDDSGCGWTAAAGDILNPVALNLGGLANHGGPTQTHALLSGSPAIDSGGPTCEAADQRGIVRPQGTTCDMGAFELEGGTSAADASTAAPLPAITEENTLALPLIGNYDGRPATLASEPAPQAEPTAIPQAAAASVLDEVRKLFIPFVAGEPVGTQPAVGSSEFSMSLTSAPPITSSLTSPPAGSVFSTTAPISISGNAASLDSLKRMVLTVDGAPVHTVDWAEGQYTQTTWSTAWTPPGEGLYLLHSTADDWAGRVQTTTVPLRITVDLEPATQLPFPDSLPFAYVPSVLDSVVILPSAGTLLTSTDPISVTAGAYAAAALKSLTLRVNGVAVDVINWPQGGASEALWSTSWRPAEPGHYVLDSIVEDWNGAIQIITTPVSVMVGTGVAPSVSLAVEHLSRQDEIQPGRLRISGRADGSGPLQVGIQTEPGGPFHAANLDGGNWTYDWLVPAGIDGESYPLTVRIIDSAGQTASDARAVVVDLVPPQPFTPTLLYQDAGGRFLPISEGETVNLAGARVAVEWTTSSDAGGLGGYLVQWSAKSEPDPATLVAVAEDVRRYEATAGEAEILYAHVIARDSHGNQRVETRGPIYVDGPSTPDLVEHWSYRGWTESGATLISSDNERSLSTGDRGPQRLYVSWNAETLRLIWSGADWSSDGDLFIYFDSSGGGASELYNPYAGAERAIRMPSAFGADYLIWIQDRTTATLLRWDGNGWLVVQRLDEETFRTDIGAIPALTDLRLPFRLLGLSPQTTLQILAVASQEDELRLWAAAPDKNPLDSEQLAGSPGLRNTQTGYQLTQYAAIEALRDGALPNGGVLAGADMRLNIESDPAGLAVSFLGDSLFSLLVPGGTIDGDLNGNPDADLPATSGVPLGRGAEIVYTIYYQNVGTEIARDVRISAIARGALQLANEGIALGDVGVGISSTVKIRGVITGESASAEMAVEISDQQHGAFEWQWVQHRVNDLPPQSVAIHNHGFARAGINLISGAVQSPVAVPQIELSITAMPGSSRTITCPDPSAMDGRWTCRWDAGDLSGVDEFQLRARATDRFGNASEWSPITTLIADTSPPTVTLNASIEGFLSDGFLNRSELVWQGQVVDNYAAAGIVVCIDMLLSVGCEQRTLAGANATAPWHFDLAGFVDAESAERTIAIYGQDAVQNRSAPLIRTVRIDTVAPLITISQPGTPARLGATTALGPQASISGQVSDGSGVTSMHAILVAADGTTVVEPIIVENGLWSYLPSFADGAELLIRIQATDRAGNSAYSPAFVLADLGVTYRLSVQIVGEGEVRPSGGRYVAETALLLTAIPENGYRFVGWKGDLGGSEISATLVMDSDKSVTALFAKLPDTGNAFNWVYFLPFIVQRLIR